jgi:Zn-dependent peptidase ImmA (M78 family)
MEDGVRAGFARQRARKVLKDCGITAPWVDLERIVAHLGYEYHVVDFPDGVDALVVTTVDGRKIAGVNARHHVHRQRFSLAHEIGHRLLGHDMSYYRVPISIDKPPEVIDHRRESRVLESEANIFAGELLVPLELLKKAYRDAPDLEKLSRIFRVSTQVISVAVMQHQRSLFK